MALPEDHRRRIEQQEVGGGHCGEVAFGDGDAKWTWSGQQDGPHGCGDQSEHDVVKLETWSGVALEWTDGTARIGQAKEEGARVEHQQEY